VTRAYGGHSLQESLDDSARAEGLILGGEAAEVPREAGSLVGLAHVLRSQGLRTPGPGRGGGSAQLPIFDALATKHRSLVCGLNRAFVQGVADGLGCPDVTASLEPDPERCCVKARLRGRSNADVV
jgi:hypothetical protein